MNASSGAVTAQHSRRITGHLANSPVEDHHLGIDSGTFSPIHGKHLIVNHMRTISHLARRVEPKKNHLGNQLRNTDALRIGNKMQNIMLSRRETYTDDFIICTPTVVLAASAAANRKPVHTQSQQADCKFPDLTVVYAPKTRHCTG